MYLFDNERENLVDLWGRVHTPPYSVEFKNAAWERSRRLYFHGQAYRPYQSRTNYTHHENGAFQKRLFKREN